MPLTRYVNAVPLFFVLFRKGKDSDLARDACTVFCYVLLGADSQTARERSEPDGDCVPAASHWGPRPGRGLYYERYVTVLFLN